MSKPDDGKPDVWSLRPIYLLTPVPLGMLGMLIGPFIGMLHGDRSPFGLLVPGLLLGYAGMGIQSVGFAAAMRWMELRSIARVVRYVVASALGALCGATLGVAGAIVDFGMVYVGVFLGVLGASVGFAVAMLGDLFASNSRHRWWFRFAGLLVAVVITSVGASAGNWVRAWSVATAREAVLAEVAIAMTSDEVDRAAGAPDRRESLSRSAAQDDMVWTYTRGDPASSRPMVVIIVFRNGKVSEVRRHVVD